jgi:hypothetical protein
MKMKTLLYPDIGMMWVLLHPDMTPEHLGLLPGMLNANDERPAREQFDANYQHGGGWHPMKGHVLGPDNSLTYPGDPPLSPLAFTLLRDEQIVFYDCSWVVIIQPDRTFEVCRMD